MLYHFHFAAAMDKKKTLPYDIVNFEETLELPSLEEVDIPAETGTFENSEISMLETLGLSILERIYEEEEITSRSMSYKGTPQEDYRL